MINSDVFIKSFRFLLTCSRCFLRNFSLNSRNRNFIIFRNAQEFRKSHILILQEQEAKQDIKMLSKAQQECALYSACLYISVFQNKNSHDNFGDHQIVLVISKISQILGHQPRRNLQEQVRKALNMLLTFQCLNKFFQ